MKHNLTIALKSQSVAIERFLRVVRESVNQCNLVFSNVSKACIFVTQTFPDTITVAETHATWLEHASPKYREMANAGARLPASRLFVDVYARSITR